MKILLRSNLLTLFLTTTLASAYLFSSCEKKNVECQAPPPELSLLLSSPPLAVEQTKVSLYSYQKGVKTPAQYLRFSPQEGNTSSGTPLLVSAGSLIQEAPKADSAQFYLEYNGQLVGRLRLETVRNNDRCNGWQQLTRLTYNRQVISPVNFAYPIVLRP